jgi:hypothetical protein
MRLRVGSRCCGFVGPSRDDWTGGFTETSQICSLHIAILGMPGSWAYKRHMRLRDKSLGIWRTFSEPTSHRAGLNLLLAHGLVVVHVSAAARETRHS